jgi:hypothetical protein
MMEDYIGIQIESNSNVQYIQRRRSPEKVWHEDEEEDESDG